MKSDLVKYCFSRLAEASTNWIYDLEKLHRFLVLFGWLGFCFLIPKSVLLNILEVTWGWMLLKHMFCKELFNTLIF